MILGDGTPLFYINEHIQSLYDFVTIRFGEYIGTMPIRQLIPLRIPRAAERRTQVN
jgi:hypothetical protein